MEEAETPCPRQRPRIAALLLLGMVVIALGIPCPGQDKPPAPAPAALSKLFTEAEKSFGARDYKTMAAKLTELLKLCDNKPEYPLEFLMFNVGFANLLDGNVAEAERAFDACAKKFPQGEYTSRCYLGIGKAAVAQGGEEKKKAAIEALKKAAADPRYGAEACLTLGQVYMDDNQPDAALAVFRGLRGAEVRTPQQTSAAVEVIGLLGAEGQVEDLVAYLDYLRGQPGVQDFIAWCSNQVVVKADALVEAEKWEAALAIYRSVPPRAQILKIQAATLKDQRKELELLKRRQKAEAKNPDAGLAHHSNVAELIASAEDALKLNEQARAAIEGMNNLDASLLMRRGRCLFYLSRREEALACFSTIREKYPDAQVAQAAAYAEIVIYNELKDGDKVQALAEAYMNKHPKAPNLQTVATLAGEVLVGKGDWKKVQAFYEEMIRRFPKTPNVERYRFYLAVALFQQGEFEKVTGIYVQWLRDFPNARRAMRENAIYRIMMGYFLTGNYDQARYWRREYFRCHQEQAMFLLRRVLPGCRLVCRPLPERMLRRGK